MSITNTDVYTGNIQRLQTVVETNHEELLNLHNQQIKQVLLAANILGKIEQGLVDNGRLLKLEHSRLENEITQLKALHASEKQGLLSAARNQVDIIGNLAYKIIGYIKQEREKADSNGLFPGCQDPLVSEGRKLGFYRSAIIYCCEYENFGKQTASLYNYYTEHPAKSFFGVGAFDLIEKKVREELNTQKSQEMQLAKRNALPLSLQTIANELSVAEKIERMESENAKQMAVNRSLENQKHDLIKIHEESIKRFKYENLSGYAKMLARTWKKEGSSRITY